MFRTPAENDEIRLEYWKIDVLKNLISRLGALVLINLVAILEDIQDQLMTELTPELKFGMKKTIGDASKHTKRFIRECDKVLSDENKEDFGFTADELRAKIEEMYYEWTT